MRRTSAAVALQSLTMLNGQFITEQADHFARRVIAAAGADEMQRIDLAFKLALARTPTADESNWPQPPAAGQTIPATASLSQERRPTRPTNQALVHLCHMLLNTNEFLYVP